MTAYDATEEISPKNPHSSVALLPSECQNFLYLALEPDALGRPWLVYIEYKNKTPYIVGLGIDLWGLADPLNREGLGSLRPSCNFRAGLP